jgi:hypothetical protein
MAQISIAGDTSGTVTLSAPSVAGTTTLTLPTTTGNVVADTATQTLTNKTLTSPTITGATITVASTAAPTFSAYTSGTGPTSNTIGTSATKVTYDTKEWDTNNNFASSRFTPTVAGYYQINAQTQPNNSYTGGFIGIFKNGSVYKYGNYTNTPVTLGGFTVSSIVYCNGSTDYIEIYGAFTTSQVTGAGICFNYFNGCFLRSA